MDDNTTRKASQRLLISEAFSYLNVAKQLKDMSRKLINLVGKTFGRLKVISLSHRKNTKVYWQCMCDCGKTVFVQSASLHQSRTRSCGCLHTDTVTKHGYGLMKEFMIWKSMKSRCINKNDPAYLDYGGRGITVCDRWLNSYENFYIDMGPRPTKNHSIDRIKNNEGYSKENCKWSTRIEQCNNRRSSLMITYNGVTQTLAQWCKELDLSYQRIHQRIKVWNWPIERAFTTKIPMR